jgi:hypothetical protein
MLDKVILFPLFLVCLWNGCQFFCFVRSWISLSVFSNVYGIENKWLYLYISLLFQRHTKNNGNNITLSSMSSYNCIARFIAPLVSSNSSYAYICILQQSIHMSLLPDHLNVICWQGNILTCNRPQRQLFTDWFTVGTSTATRWPWFIVCNHTPVIMLKWH